MQNLLINMLQLQDQPQDQLQFNTKLQFNNLVQFQYNKVMSKNLHHHKDINQHLFHKDQLPQYHQELSSQEASQVEVNLFFFI